MPQEILERDRAHKMVKLVRVKPGMLGDPKRHAPSKVPQEILEARALLAAGQWSDDDDELDPDDEYADDSDEQLWFLQPSQKEAEENADYKESLHHQSAYVGVEWNNARRMWKCSDPSTVRGSVAVRGGAITLGCFST